MLSNIIEKKINQGHKRSQKAKKNIIASFAIKGGSVLINLALVPITIKYVNAEEYGIWLTISSIIAWFSFFDIGFGHGLRNKFAEAVAKGEHELAKIYVSTTYIVLLIVVIIIWLLFILINPFINWAIILNVSDNLNIVLTSAVLIVFSFFCIQFILKLINTVLTANQQPAKAATFELIVQLFTLGWIFFLEKMYGHGSLTELAIATGTSQFIVFSFATIFFFRGSLKKYSPSIKYIKISYTRSLIGVGIKFFIIQMASIFVFQTTNIIVTQLLGPEQVTVYNISFKYFSLITMLSGIVSAPFWSAFTEAYVKEDYEWMQKIYKRINYFWLLNILFTLVLLLFSEFFYKLWIGSSVSIPLSISILMCINTIMISRQNLFITLINGTGKVQLQLLTNVALSFVFLPMAILLGKYLSLNGIILASIIINSIYAIIVPIQSRLITSGSAKGIWNK